jgi:hypothetical protein
VTRSIRDVRYCPRADIGQPCRRPFADAIAMVEERKPFYSGGTPKEFHNVAVIYGLHVALPDDMKALSPELVPLP